MYYKKNDLSTAEDGSLFSRQIVRLQQNVPLNVIICLMILILLTVLRFVNASMANLLPVRNWADVWECFLNKYYFDEK